MILRAPLAGLALVLLLSPGPIDGGKNLYEALGVAETADDRTIKKAYRKAAL